MPRLAAFSVVLVAAVAAMAAPGAAAEEADEAEPVPTRPLTVVFQSEEQVAFPPFIDELAPQTVLVIRALGFEPNTTGGVAQCVGRDEPRCQNHLPVRFDGQGAATFQYLVTEAALAIPGETPPCRLGGAGCTIQISNGTRVATIDTVFVDAAPPPGRIDIQPRDDLDVGRTVTITATGFPGGAELTALVCVEPAASGTRCGPPGLEVPLTVGPDGTASATATIETAEVGSDGVSCGGATACRLVVVSDDVGVRAEPVPLSFAAAPSAGYSVLRLVLGLGTAVALLTVAAWLVRSTDWRPPREADSSLIDDAELADLDLEAALFEEGEARETVGT